MPAVRVQNLSKEYAIGARKRAPDTIRALLVQSIKAPFRRFRRLRGDAPPEERIWALRDVSFEVQPGEIVGIIGKNGAGKSTLLKILSSITEPTAGRAFLNGRVSSLLEVGTGFHPELTGRENVYLNGTLLGMEKAEIRRKFDEIVAFSEVEKFIDTPVKHYSSGMYVRLAFAVAAHLEPEILIVDEVLAVGDAAFQRKCLGKMRDIGGEGRAILFVSHNMHAVQTLCGRAILLNDGRVVLEGEVSAVVSGYLAGSSRSVLSVRWSDPDSAPGNDRVRLRSARVVPDDGEPLGSITVKTPLRIELEYVLDGPDCQFNISLHLLTMDGDCVFVTMSSAEKIRRGVYRSSCYIPADLLNNRTYTVNVFFGRDGSVVLFRAQNLLTFDVLDVPRDPGSFLGELPGAVRPRLRWRSEIVDAP